MKVFIGCGSRDEVRDSFVNESRRIANYLASLGYDLICGGTSGLMQVCSEAFLAKGRKVSVMAVSKYYPVVFETGDIWDWNSIADRKRGIIDKASLLVFLPGGIGTWDELFSAIESRRAQEHNKSIIIVNIDNYYDNLLKQLEVMYEEKFCSEKDKQFYYVASSVDEAIKYMEEVVVKDEGKN